MEAFKLCYFFNCPNFQTVNVAHKLLHKIDVLIPRNLLYLIYNYMINPLSLPSDTVTNGNSSPVLLRYLNVKYDSMTE
jgi:hypothetical protein